MKIGLSLNGDHVTLEETLQFARQAEANGFASIWVPEAWRDAFVPLTAIALQTSRVRIGTAIALAMARSPVLMEKASASLDELSHGRLTLGIGPGPKAWNEDWHGVTFHPPAAYIREYAEVLRLMWSAHSGKHIDYAGTYLNITDYQRFVQPYREQIPIYFGAVMPRFLRAAGAVADGLCVASFHTPRYLREVVYPNLDAGRKAQQSAARKQEVVTTVICAVDPDGDTARQRVKGQLAFYASIPYYDVVLDLHAFGQDKTRIREAAQRGDNAGMIAGVSDELVDQVAIAGTPQECRDKLAQHQGLVDEVILTSPSFGLSRAEVVRNHQHLLAAFQ
jgi:probable F420-dependent oxidoreductase